MSYQTKVRANNMNKTAKLAFYTSRSRKGDTSILAEKTGYTPRFIDYVKKGERSVNTVLAKEMYYISRRRVKNSQLI